MNFDVAQQDTQVVVLRIIIVEADGVGITERHLPHGAALGIDEPYGRQECLGRFDLVEFGSEPVGVELDRRRAR